MYLDAHCHIDHLNTDQISDYISSFSYERWSWLVCIWTNLDDSKINSQIYQDTTNICNESNIKLGYTVGIHPWSVVDLDEQALTDLEDLIVQWLENKFQYQWLVGIWEIGTDLHYEIDDDVYEKQKYFFDEQCKLAIKYNLPVVIHSRDDFSWTLEIVKKYDDLKVYFHCRWYWPEQLEILQSVFEDNLWIWFCGNISYPKAIELRDSFKHAWENNIKIVLETDTPYLSIQSLRWQPNQSSNIPLHYDYISETFGIDKDNLIDKVKQNYDMLYW